MSYNQSPALFEKIHMSQLRNRYTRTWSAWLGYNPRWTATVALFDTGFNFQNALLPDSFAQYNSQEHSNFRDNTLEIASTSRAKLRADHVSLILAGKPTVTSDGISRSGVTPGVQIIPYSENRDQLAEALKDSSRLAQIAILSANDLDIDPILDADVASLIVVIRGGDSYASTDQTIKMSDKGAEYFPQNGNILVVVGVDENGALKDTSKKCGPAKNFCVGVPTSGYSTQSTPIAAGALVLLMQAVPRLTPAQYVRALLDSASQSTQPDEQIGMGVIHVEEALKKLPNLQPPTTPSWQRLQNGMYRACQAVASGVSCITSRFPAWFGFFNPSINSPEDL
jgi:hypothetical protein